MGPHLGIGNYWRETGPVVGSDDGLEFFGVELGQAKHDTGEHSSYRAIQVNLLRDGDDPHAFLAPFCQKADAFMLAAGQTVQFPAAQ